MLRYPLFRAGIVGGSLFRIGIGAVPFLLPLMLQLGFGLTPFELGLVTFIGAVGALSSKFGASWVFRSFGFRAVLGFGALASAAFIAVNAAFIPATPVPLIMAVLLVGGVLRSICFTGINAMVFGDVDEADAAQATAINSAACSTSAAGCTGRGRLAKDFERSVESSAAWALIAHIRRLTRLITRHCSEA